MIERPLSSGLFYNSRDQQMIIRRLKDCQEIIAGDGTRLRELLHPDGDYRFSGRYSLAHAVLPPGFSSLKHRLKSNEVYYILTGRGKMHINDECAEVFAGDAVDIPPDSIQWIVNAGNTDLAFLCIVDPAWQVEDEQVF
jgi:mannose-6-phosphate isomerase-like protein (cupin superfamily)